jgi:hypothetical protein
MKQPQIKLRAEEDSTIFSDCDYSVSFILIEPCTIRCNYPPNEQASISSFPLL